MHPENDQDTVLLEKPDWYEDILYELHEEEKEFARQIEEQLNKYILKGSPSGKSVMVTIKGGVAELWPSGLVDAALDTDQGPISLEGGRVISEDLQSGPITEWKSSLELTNSAIREAFDRFSPSVGLEVISDIWGELDRSAELAEARSNILLGKVEPLQLAETPEWFLQQKDVLLKEHADEYQVSPWALESTELLIRACVANVGAMNELTAEVTAGPLGRIWVDWHIPQGRYQWLVDATDLPWPCVKVYLLRQDKTNSKAETKVLHNAYQVTEEFKLYLGE